MKSSRMRADYPLILAERAGEPLERVADIPEDASRTIVKRIKASHRSLIERSKLREVLISGANQDVVDEIAALDGPEFLYLDYPVTASDLSPLTRLTKLRTLILTAVRAARDFTPLLALSQIEVLMIEQAQNLRDLDFLSNAHHLRLIDVSGSIWTKQPIASVRPLSSLSGLEELVMTSVKLGDTDLSPLA